MVYGLCTTQYFITYLCGRDLRILEAEQLNLRTDADVLVTRQIKIRRLAKTAIFALAAVFAVFRL